MQIPCENKIRYLEMVIEEGIAYEYEEFPIKQEIEMPYFAWGSGAKYALGAMAKGASAEEAINIACQFDPYSGNGVTLFDTSL